MKWHLDPSNCLATIDMGQKWGLLCPLFGEGELGPHLTQCGQGWGLPPCQVSCWSIQLFGYNNQCYIDRQRSHGIGQTVLQTDAQKSLMLPLYIHYKCVIVFIGTVYLIYLIIDIALFLWFRVVTRVVFQLSYIGISCVNRHLKLRNWGYCRSMPACPCWHQLALLD